MTGAAATLCGAPPAWALTQAELAQRLHQRLAGDRTGVCLQAAVLDASQAGAPPQLLRADFCARTGGGAAPPPATNAAFEIGSISKTMTALLVAQLVGDGLWSLDDPINRHLPPGTPVPRQGERHILLRDLLTHSAGLPALPPGWRPAQPDNPYADLSEATLLEALGQVQLQRPIGSQAAYSNFGMMLVSLAATRALGGDLPGALRARVFQPLGMQHSFVGTPPPGVPLATGHHSWGGPAPAWTISPPLAGVGMVRASLADMLLYAQAQLLAQEQAQTPPSAASASAPEQPVLVAGTHLGGATGGPAAGQPTGPKQGLAPSASTTAPTTSSTATLRRAMALTQEPLAHGFGMNWLLPTVGGRRYVLHGGTTGGFSAMLVLDLAAQRAVVLLADTQLPEPLDDLALSLLGAPVPLRPPRRPVALPAAQAQALAGDYLLGDLPLRLWAEGDRLLVQAAPQAPSQAASALHLDSRGDLYSLVSDAWLRPLREGQGASQTVVGFLWHQGGGVLEARRVGQDTGLSASNPAWRDWAGAYQIAPGFSLKVFERDGRLMLQGSGQSAMEAEVTGADRIEVKAVGAVLLFQRNAAGQVSGASLQQNGHTLSGPKRPVVASAAAFAASSASPASSPPAPPEAERPTVTLPTRPTRANSP